MRENNTKQTNTTAARVCSAVFFFLWDVLCMACFPCVTAIFTHAVNDCFCVVGLEPVPLLQKALEIAGFLAFQVDKAAAGFALEVVVAVAAVVPRQVLVARAGNAVQKVFVYAALGRQLFQMAVDGYSANRRAARLEMCFHFRDGCVLSAKAREVVYNQVVLPCFILCFPCHSTHSNLKTVSY